MSPLTKQESKPEPATRRRGKQLEDALLDAAWDQLVSGGYSGFTIDAVAERAATSRHVIYRRWATREQLVLAAVRRNSAITRQPIPDTGSLRGDVIALLTVANKNRLTFAAVISVQLAAYFQETGTAPADLRSEIIGDEPTSSETIMQRAIERGEVDPARLTPRIINLPFDLLRHDVLMTLKPLSAAAIVDIVDGVFLPLVMPG